MTSLSRPGHHSLPVGVHGRPLSSAFAESWPIYSELANFSIWISETRCSELRFIRVNGRYCSPWKVRKVRIGTDRDLEAGKKEKNGEKRETDRRKRAGALSDLSLSFIPVAWGSVLEINIHDPPGYDFSDTRPAVATTVGRMVPHELKRNRRRLLEVRGDA